MDLLDQLYSQAVLPVLRSPSWREAVEAVQSLRDGGCSLVELTTSTPEWARAVGRLADWGQPVGVGTIRSREDAGAALEAGAAFLVSPFPVSGVAELARTAGVPFIQGGFTPAELHLAATTTHAATTHAATSHAATSHAGATVRPGIAKVFPAHLGGPRYLHSLAPVLPGVRLVPTGGIGWDDVPAYLEAGAFAVGIGSGLDLPPGELTAALARVRRG